MISTLVEEVPFPVSPPDNEKARWPIVGSVSKQDGDNEKARNTPLGGILTLGSSVLSRPFWLKALSSRSPKFSVAPSHHPWSSRSATLHSLLILVYPMRAEELRYLSPKMAEGILSWWNQWQARQAGCGNRFAVHELQEYPRAAQLYPGGPHSFSSAAICHGRFGCP